MLSVARTILLAWAPALLIPAWAHGQEQTSDLEGKYLAHKLVSKLALAKEYGGHAEGDSLVDNLVDKLADKLVGKIMEQVQDRVPSSMNKMADKFIESLISTLFDSALKVSHLQDAELDNATTLGTHGRSVIPSRPSMLRPLPPLRTQPRVAARAATMTVQDPMAIKSQILQIAALTDRGQRLNKFIAETYQEKRTEMSSLVEGLIASGKGKVSEAQLAGDWELVYADVELFRSSPFFLAIEEALNGSPGTPRLGRWLGATDPKKKAEVFFKLHQLQVLSWGLSTVGRIGQKLNFQEGVIESSFDTTIFGLTVIPIIGWFKLLPTFGGRVVTEATGLKLYENGTLCMELSRTKVETAPGIPRIPLVNKLFMDRWYPVNAVWKLLPWNGGPFNGRAPTCSLKVEYVDEQMRISRDSAGGIFVYTRPISLGGTS